LEKARSHSTGNAEVEGHAGVRRFRGVPEPGNSFGRHFTGRGAVKGGLGKLCANPGGTRRIEGGDREEGGIVATLSAGNTDDLAFLEETGAVLEEATKGVLVRFLVSNAALEGVVKWTRGELDKGEGSSGCLRETLGRAGGKLHLGGLLRERLGEVRARCCGGGDEWWQVHRSIVGGSGVVERKHNTNTAVDKRL
jgi:hypothetical protein